MAKEVMCAYGNCTESVGANSQTKITVTESHNGTVSDRQSFCCYEHACLWLQKRADQRISAITQRLSQKGLA